MLNVCNSRLYSIVFFYFISTRFFSRCLFFSPFFLLLLKYIFTHRYKDIKEYNNCSATTLSNTKRTQTMKELVTMIIHQNLERKYKTNWIWSSGQPMKVDSHTWKSANQDYRQAKHKELPWLAIRRTSCIKWRSVLKFRWLVLTMCSKKRVHAC